MNYVNSNPSNDPFMCPVCDNLSLYQIKESDRNGKDFENMTMLEGWECKICSFFSMNTWQEKVFVMDYWGTSIEKRRIIWSEKIGKETTSTDPTKEN